MKNQKWKPQLYSKQITETIDSAWAVSRVNHSYFSISNVGSYVNQ